MTVNGREDLLEGREALVAEAVGRQQCVVMSITVYTGETEVNT